MTKLIIIDDYAKEIKELMKKVACLETYKKGYLDFSTISPIDHYNCGDYTRSYEKGKIVDATCKAVNKLIKGAQSYLILMDYELCRPKPNMTEGEFKAYNDANEEARKGVIDAIIDRDDVYLMLYTRIDPGAVSLFYDGLVKRIAESNGKMHLFHRMLFISFFAQPVNYQHISKQVIEREIKFIDKKLKDKGEMNNGHWPTADEFYND